MTEAPTKEWYEISMELTDTYLLINSQQPYENDDSKYICKQYMDSSNLLYDEKRLSRVKKMITGTVQQKVYYLVKEGQLFH